MSKWIDFCVCRLVSCNQTAFAAGGCNVRDEDFVSALYFHYLCNYE